MIKQLNQYITEKIKLSNDRFNREKITAESYDGKIDGHKYIDLDLPSGNLWCMYNVDAKTPEDDGVHLSFGINIQTDGCSGAYLHHFNNGDMYFKDDAAKLRMGNKWEIPNKQDFEELFKLEHEWVESGLYNRPGIVFTGYNGHKLYFPAGGSLCEDNMYSENIACFYWTNEVKTMDGYYCWAFWANNKGICKMEYDESLKSFCIRAVSKK